MSLAKAACVSVLLLLTPIVSSRGVSYDYGFDVSQVIKRQDAKVFVVQPGQTNTAASVPMRQDVRQLQQDPYAWNLYLLSMSMMQYTSQDNLLSWYSICGIHGVPFVTWDGVEPTPGNENTGYCQHLSVVFPTWHRAYLALFEQILANYAQNIASWYPNDSDKPNYLSAAANFRLPYWDWATPAPAGESILPSSIGGSSTVNVSGPNGIQQIAHPLYSYAFKPLNPSDFIEPPWSEYRETVRAPTPENALAQSNNTLVGMTLDANADSLRQRLFNLFSNYPNFSDFSNEAWIPGGTNASYDSVESLHDTIHTLSGLQGHMAYVPFSCFDPIFWLHHCMVDRAFAMWQMLYPNSWITPTPAPMNSYTTSVGQVLNSQSPLTPFYAGSNGSFWNSDMVRNPAVFGYTYPEISGFNGPNTKAQVIRAINRLYGGSSAARLARQNAKTERTDKKGTLDGLFGRRRRAEGHAKGRDDSGSAAAPLNRIIIDNQYQEWIANVRVRKQALSGSFSIHFYLDDVPDDPATWSHAESLVGTMSVFASPPPYDRGMPNHRTAGTVPLTAALIKRVRSGDLHDLHPDNVQPFLLDRLHVRVTLTNGTAVEASDVQELSVSIVSSTVNVAKSDEELPKWGPAVYHFDFI